MASKAKQIISLATVTGNGQVQLRKLPLNQDQRLHEVLDPFLRLETSERASNEGFVGQSKLLAGHPGRRQRREPIEIDSVGNRNGGDCR